MQINIILKQAFMFANGLSSNVTFGTKNGLKAFFHDFDAQDELECRNDKQGSRLKFEGGSFDIIKQHFHRKFERK